MMVFRSLKLWILAAFACFSDGVAVGVEPQRWAILIGVNDYVDINDLSYAGADATALGETLAESGFSRERIFLLHDEAKEARYKPFKKNIEKQLQIVLKLAGPDDLVVVSFSGHGMHIDGKSYLCPSEADDTDPTGSMIAIDDVYKQFDACQSALKLMVIDACRDDPRPPSRRSATPENDRKNFSSTFERPPDGIVVLASCGAGQKSYEDKTLKHGVFMHYVLKGLSGDADGNNNGRVSLGELYEYASGETKLFVAKSHNDFQVPAQRGEINGIFELPRSTPPPAVAPFGTAKAKQHQDAWAKYLRDPVEKKNSIGMTFRLIPPGAFMMGMERPLSEFLLDFPYCGVANANDSYPSHHVTIARPFYLGTHEVTLGQFLTFYHDSKYKLECERDGKGCKGWGERGWEVRANYRPWDWGFAEQTQRHPIVNVSWNDAVAFCEWLSKKEGKTYRLPTEAEWEYACRAGTTTWFSFGNDPEDLVRFANSADVARSVINGTEAKDWEMASRPFPFILRRDGFGHSAPIGSFVANPFGLHDMHGNAFEWVSDWEATYSESPQTDPVGPNEGTLRVYRGGCWDSIPACCRSTDRHGDEASFRLYSLGFRVSLVP